MKVSFLYAGTLYTALTARAADIRKERTTDAIGLARASKASLERQEDELLRVMRRNQLILQSAGVGIVGFDLEGRVTFANERAANTIGLDVDSPVGTKGHDLAVHSDDAGKVCDGSNCPLEAALRSQKEEHGENAGFFRPDGSIVPVSYTSAPIVENGAFAGIEQTKVELFSMPLAWLIASFFAMSAFAHFLAGWPLRARYEAWLARGMNLGRPLPNFVLLIGLCSIGFVALCAVLFLVGRKILAHLPAPFRQGKAWWAAMAVWTVLSTFALLALSGRLTVPVPRGLPYPASAVGSLRTSAGDLALLLIELSEPRFLSADTAAQIRTPQISAGDGFSWGLGIGIQHSDQGNSLWQNGQTFGFRSLMGIYPEHRIGVVVLTNSDHGLSAAHDVAQRALGGKARWKYF